MFAAFALIAIGAALIVAGAVVAVNAKKIGASAEREFYGPVTPTAKERKRDRWITGALGADTGRWILFGAELIVFGMVLGAVGINLAVRGVFLSR
jgi:hypothetical protein